MAQKLEAVAPLDRLGTRVRVCLPAGRACEDMPHHPVEDGRTGVVVQCACRPDGSASSSHPCFVQLDEELTWELGSRPIAVRLRFRHFAVDELELLA